MCNSFDGLEAQGPKGFCRFSPSSFSRKMGYMNYQDGVKSAEKESVDLRWSTVRHPSGAQGFKEGKN